MTLGDDKREFERRKIREALGACKGVQTHAAAALGISPQWMRKRLAALFTEAERAEMAAKYGWHGKRRCGHRMYADVCTLAEGHDGPHRNGGLSWEEEEK